MANNNFTTAKTLREVLAKLSEPVPESFISSKSVFQKGKSSGSVKYIAWPALIRLLDSRAELMWDWKIRTIWAGDRFVVEGSLTIHACDGSITREATGTEMSDVDSYGDPTSNAEAMALRRCCAKFGVGLNLWEKSAKQETAFKPQESNYQPPQTQKNTLSKEQWLARHGVQNEVH